MLRGGRFWRGWLCVLAVWTFALVAPGTWFGQAATAKVGEIGVGKILHFAIYALLAGSAGWLPAPMKWRLAIALPLLSAHGALTEFLQTHVAAREGCVRDWIIDTVGIALGFALTWRWWPADRLRSGLPGPPMDTAGGRG